MYPKFHDSLASVAEQAGVSFTRLDTPDDSFFHMTMLIFDIGFR